MKDKSFKHSLVLKRIIKDVNKGLLNSILVEMQPANIQNKCNKALSSTERDINRAKFIREKLTSSTTAK